MSKKINMTINNYLLSKIEKPIRKKIDIIMLVLETINLVLIGKFEDVKSNYGRIIINIDKMSRIIYELENKIFSINFPFNLETTERGYIIKYNGIIIDSQMVSDLISMILILEKDEDIDNLFDKIVDFPQIYIIFKHLLMLEYGYIRYDYDKEHHKEKIHPENHLDINCMQSNQYKIGIEKRINMEEFIDILDLNTNCYFLKKS